MYLRVKSKCLCHDQSHIFQKRTSEEYKNTKMPNSPWFFLLVSYLDSMFLTEETQIQPVQAA